MLESNRRALLFSTFLIGVLLLTQGCQGPAGPAGPEGPAGPAGPPGPGGAKGLAAVAADATLIRGVNVQSVARQDPGYVVTFTADVDVANGYYFVTPGLVGSCNTLINAEKTAGNSVYVSFGRRGPGISFADCAFSLAVF